MEEEKIPFSEPCICLLPGNKEKREKMNVAAKTDRLIPTKTKVSAAGRRLLVPK